MSTRFADSYYLTAKTAFCKPECVKLIYQSRKLYENSRDHRQEPTVSVGSVVKQPDGLRIPLGI